MVYKRNRSKKCNSRVQALAFFAAVVSVASADISWAAFASRFSLSVGEQFTDNLFFDNSKEKDFVTLVTPTLSLLFAPQGATAPTVNLNISPSAQFYANHSDRNNFGRSLSLNAGYTENLTPRLALHVSDVLGTTGSTQLGNLGGSGQLGTTTSIPNLGGLSPTSPNQNLQNFTSGGNVLNNNFALRGTFLAQPDLSFSANYSNHFVRYLSQGGSDIFQTIGARAIYNWRQEHNLHAGYTISVGNARNGSNNVIHNFDIGDDFFSNAQLRLSPTLTVALSSGFSINTGGSGPRIANNSNLSVTKIWQVSTLTAGIRKGLTPSFGISGISDTTAFYASFNSQLTEKLTLATNFDYSLFDTDDVNFKTLRSTVGLQYPINSWLSSNLSYSFRSSDRGSGSAVTASLLQKGTVRSNTVLLSLAAHFDLWPNPGLSRGTGISVGTPLIRPPFSQGQPPSGGAEIP